MKYSMRVATTSEDFRRCHRLARTEGVKADRLSFPTVMALDEDKRLLGFLSTDTSQDLIVAGPLVMASDKRRPMLALKLAEAYELALRNLGITSYIMAVAPDSLMEKALQRYTPETECYAEAEGHKFYIRRLPEWAAA